MTRSIDLVREPAGNGLDAQKNGLDVSASAEQVTPKSSRKCPLCGKETLQKARPFCSIRCANIDLHRWLGEGYAIPSEDEDIPASEIS